MALKWASLCGGDRVAVQPTGNAARLKQRVLAHWQLASERLTRWRRSPCPCWRDSERQVASSYLIPKGRKQVAVGARVGTHDVNGRR
jgi:hypothetical protein